MKSPFRVSAAFCVFLAAIILLVAHRGPKKEPIGNFAWDTQTDKNLRSYAPVFLDAKRKLLAQNRPVVFFARALDQNGAPVSNTRLELRLSSIDETKVLSKFPHMKMGSEIQNEEIVLLSDKEGWFRLTDRKGTLLVVKSLSCEGYIWQATNYVYFDYDGKAGAKDWENPEIGYLFRLWKKGQTEDLVKFGFGAEFGNSEKKVAFNIFTGLINNPDKETADFVIQRTFLYPSNPERHYDCRISIIGLNGNSLAETFEYYPFYAATANYASELTYDILPSTGYGPHGTWDWKRNFYIRARDGKVYGLFTIDFSAGKMSFSVNELLNTSGSRNLEPDREKIITDPVEIQRLDEYTRVP